MELRDRIRHLYRRLGFGITVAELEEAEKRGLSKTIDLLLEFDSNTDPIPIASSEFTWREKEEADLGAWRYRVYWVYRMMATPRPLEEKMALFWHSHFAVSDNKVEFGPKMLAYYETIRRHGMGRFEDLLMAVAKDPAMMTYLDMQRAFRGRPNENFAREVMELFTLGIGNYTEEDVQELSRALTGWGYIDTYWELPGDATAKLRDQIKYRRPFSTFTYMPPMRDDTPKTILGVKKDWDGDTALKMLANHPQTAQHVARKLLEFFVTSQPSPAYVEKVASAFRRHKGDIRRTVRAMVEASEFWDPKVVRTHAKSPADYCISLVRQQRLAAEVVRDRAKDANEYSRIPQTTLDQCGYVAYRMDRMGLSLFYPIDVSGWKWGKEWFSPAAMAERMQFQGLWVTGGKDEPDKATQNFIELMKAAAPKSAKDVTLAFCEIYDFSFEPPRLAVLEQIAAYFGGEKFLEDKGKWGALHFSMLKVASAAPEAHLN